MSEHINNLTTLCYIEKDDQYLMLHRVKKRQDVNRDKWIGVGGHFEAGESPEECLLREVREETGLTLTGWQFRGIVTFTFRQPDVDTVGWMKDGKLVKDDIVQADTEYMCLYTADEYQGTISDCEEGTLEWVPKDAIYQLPIWEGDKVFFHLLETRKDFFSLKLDYVGEELVRVVLDGQDIPGDVYKQDGIGKAVYR